MSRADFNFANNFSNNKKFNHNFDGFEDIWQTIDDVSSISFEILIPNQNIVKKEEKSDLNKYIFSLEELMMRQNLVDLAIRENATVRENKKNPYIDLFTQDFAGHISDMTEDDVKFFQLIVNNQKVTINNSNSLIVENENGEKILENLNFSKRMMDMVEYLYTSNRPLRLDFADDLSIILRIDRQGQISAEFIATSKAMEYLLKTNIPLLKQKLDSAGIKYKKIYYKEEDEKEKE